MKIIVAGSLNMDIIIPIRSYPRAGETVTGGAITWTPGGKGANQAVAASRLGADVSMLGSVGKDTYGEQMVQALVDEHMDTKYIHLADEATGQAFIHLEHGGENRIILAPGANAAFSLAVAEQMEGALQDADAMLIQLEIPLDTVAFLVGLANCKGIPVFLDPAPATQQLFDVVPKAAWITPNEHEAKRLTGIAIVDERSAYQAARTLQSRGYANVLLKAGENGAYALFGDTWLYEPSFTVDVQDTTAAGDAFNAAFVVEWISSRDVTRALRLACAAGALTATQRGAQTSLPVRAAVAALVESRSR